MKAQLFFCVLVVFFPHPGILHEESEQDYWEMEQFYQDSVYHFPHKLTDQLPYMRVPGARCSPTMHFDARIYHHAVSLNSPPTPIRRHNLNIITAIA